MKVLGPYYAEIFGQIFLPQSPRQEKFWVLAGFESIEESVMLSDASLRLNFKDKTKQSRDDRHNLIIILQ